MDLGGFKVRRATVDDLPQLISLWQLEQLPWQEMERQVTEYQVAQDQEGRILGIIGFQMAAGQGRIHSEAFLQSELADLLREKLWERIQCLAQNHALVRLWTHETAPFWHGNGFHRPAAEQLQKLPSVFGDATAAWLMLPLRAESAPVDLDKEFNLFKESERARTQEAFRQARALRTVAFILASLLFLGVVIGMTYLVLKSGQRP